MRRRTIELAKSAAGLAAGIGAVMIMTGVLVGVMLTATKLEGEEID